MITFKLPFFVPYYAQIASPDLAEAIFVKGMNPIDDPRWAETGATTPAEYAFWVERACGVACLKMVVEALNGPNRSLIEWARLVSSRGGYIIHQNPDGTTHEIGWSHRSLAEVAQESGLFSTWKPATSQELLEDLLKNRLVIASVSYEAGDDTLPITKKGGHLMVIYGADFTSDGPKAFYVNNPSGRRKNLQVGARLPIERFTQGFSERIITFEKPPTDTTTKSVCSGP